MNDPAPALTESHAKPPLTDRFSSFSSFSHQGLLTVLIALVCTVPILAVQLPPLNDVLGHIGRFSLQIGLDADPWLQQFYSFKWQVIGNLGADILVQLLAPALGVVSTVRLILAITQFIAALAILLISRELHGRITALSLFALPFIYGYPFTFGFLNFSLSMSLALLAFVYWLRLGKRKAWLARAGLFAPLSLALWLCHVYGWVFLGMLCTGASLAEARAEGGGWLSMLWRTGLRCSGLLVPVVPMLLWRADAVGAQTTGWFFLGVKLIWLLSALRLEHQLIDLLSVVAVIIVVMCAYRVERLPRHVGLWWALGIAIVAFLVLPSKLFGSAFADMRLVPYLFILALLSFDTTALSPMRGKAFMTVGLAFLCLRLTLTTTVYVDREGRLEDYLNALRVIPQHSRVVTMVALPCGWQLPWIIHLGSLAIADRQSFTNDQWHDPGVNLLSVHYPQAGEFSTDPSQIIAPADPGNDGTCAYSDKLTLNDALARFPAKAFTHLWIANVSPRHFPKAPSLQPLWSGKDSIVYRIVQSPKGARSSSAMPKSTPSLRSR